MKKRPAKTTLLVEDDDKEADLIHEMFKDQGSYAFELTHVKSMSEAEKILDARSFDIVLLDLGLADPPGLEAVRRVRKVAPRISIVLLSSPDDEPIAVQALQEGVQDYLIKDQIEPRELMRSLLNASDRKVIEETLFGEKERAQITLDCIGDAVICTDNLSNITFLNRVAERLTGWQMKDVIGRPMAEACRIVDATTRQDILDPMLLAITENRKGQLPLNSLLIARDGREFFVEDSVAPIRNREKLVTGAVIVFRDASSARALERKLIHTAQHDSLTGLPNRALLNDRVNQAIALAQRLKGQIAVLFLDLDGFKHINDSLGHLIGDKLLQSVAKRLHDCMRTPDTVSRQGGDEFVVLLQQLKNPEDAAITARRLLRAVAQRHSIEGQDIYVTTSIGISLYPSDGKDADTLFKNADTAMYQAKRNGRQTFQFFGPGINLDADERYSIEQGLRRALERHEFALHYQPKIDLNSGAITGAEALLRWTHPTLGMVSPEQFIPVAEESGLILPIGAWVLHEACSQAQAWADAGLKVGTTAVNVSAVQFRADDFLDGMVEGLGDSGLDPQFLELEMTESVLMRNPKLTGHILSSLRNKGVRISVDDFGTGYSSLSYLQQFPLDSLKIDQSFVRRIGGTPDGKTVVSAIINLGQSLQLRVIAEGVEKLEDLVFLKTQDCDEAQGYYFSYPVPAEQFACLVQAQ